MNKFEEIVKIVCIILFIFWIILVLINSRIKEKDPYSFENNYNNCLEVNFIYSKYNNSMVPRCVRFWTGDWERTVSYDEWDFPNFSPVIQGGFVVSNFNN